MAIKTLFIGAGSMGGAILRGALQEGLLQAEEVYVTEHREETCRALEEELSIKAGTALPPLGEIKEIIFAVKPKVLPFVLQKVKEGGYSKETTLISIAAGISLEQLQEQLPSEHWYRAMPNIPVLVKAGFTAVANSDPEGEPPQLVMDLFNALGKAVFVSEGDLDCIGALGGAGTGFVFVLIDALADAGVKIGLTRPVAIEAAIQTMLGAGQLANATGEHPAQLRDKVASPGGTTIAGITALEKHGGRTAMHEAVLASYEKGFELGKKQ